MSRSRLPRSIGLGSRNRQEVVKVVRESRLMEHLHQMLVQAEAGSGALTSLRDGTQFMCRGTSRSQFLRLEVVYRHLIQMHHIQSTR